MESILLFCTVVGVASTIVLDVWVLIVQKVTGIPPTNWGIVGRWVLGLFEGELVIDDASSEPSIFERTVGWLFHYVIGISYAILLILIYGEAIISNPTVMPFVIVGLVISTIAGLGILMPALGAGFFGRLLPNKPVTYLYVIVAHAVFATAQYYVCVLVFR